MKEKICGGHLKCEVNYPNLIVRFDDDKWYFKFTLRNEYSYDGFRNELLNIYNSCDDKKEALWIINDTIQTNELDKYAIDRCLLIGPRTEEEIQAYEEEAFDKVWLMRNCCISTREPQHEVSRSGMKRILSTYDDIPENGYTDWECGYWNGILGALRWVLGEEKDFLDT